MAHRSHALVMALALSGVGAFAFAQSAPGPSFAASETAWITEATAVCVNCHGATSGDDASLAPKLGGQRPAYFEQALRSYRTPARDHFFMRGIAAGFSRAEVSTLARYFGAAPEAAPIAPQPAPPAVVQRCLACHLPASDRDTEFPVLHGQHEAYLKKALGDYVAGRRTHATMRAVVAAEDGKPLMSEQEISEASRWFAAQKGLVVR